MLYIYHCEEEKRYIEANDICITEDVCKAKTPCTQLDVRYRSTLFYI
jgi:hypothetical protein